MRSDIRENEKIKARLARVSPAMREMVYWLLEDATWNRLSPVEPRPDRRQLKKRFPNATREELDEAIESARADRFLLPSMTKIGS
jgi:hypothetical protein